MGGNQGEVKKTFHSAMMLMTRKIGRIVRVSSVYSTQAWGPVPQGDFLNQAILIETVLSPGLLLKALLEIELEFGRKRQIKYGPRTLDLDVLFYGHQIICTSNLKVPHPELPNRRFALVPMDEIAGSFRHPMLQLSISELLKNCQDQLEVKPI